MLSVADTQSPQLVEGCPNKTDEDLEDKDVDDLTICLELKF